MSERHDDLEERLNVPVGAGNGDDEAEDGPVEAEDAAADEAEGDDGEDLAQDPEAEEDPAPRSRAERRIRTLRRRTSEQEAELQSLRLALANGHSAAQSVPPPSPSRAQIDPRLQAELDQLAEEQLAMMPFDEQQRYVREQINRDVQGQLARERLELRDLLDRQSFDRRMQDGRLPASYRLIVDRDLAAARAQGMNPSREFLLHAAIGREVMANKDRAVRQQREAGQRRIESQTTRPIGARSTAAGLGRRGRDPDAGLDDRLRNITLGQYGNIVDR